MRTRLPLVVGAVCLCLQTVRAQERPVPKDSTRVSIPGCVRGSTFIAGARREDEPVRSDVQPGQRFRLAASKSVLKDIEKQKGSMVEITGLVRKSQIAPGGVSVLGGRVRIGGAAPTATSNDPARDPRYSEIVLDVESWQPLPEVCPSR